MLGAVGVDVEGKKHVLGVREGASENAEVARALLEDLVARGVDTGRRRLFVLDGSKALRSALDQVFGRQHRVQRCRNHKVRNVVGHLPKELQAQARATMRAAWKLEAKEGEQKLDQFARWLEVGETILMLHSQANNPSFPHLIGGHGDWVWPNGKFNNSSRTTAGSRPRIAVARPGGSLSPLPRL